MELTDEQYLEAGGFCCPLCGEDGGIEGGHSFEQTGDDITYAVLCSHCESLYNELYTFKSWSINSAPQGCPLQTCPRCGATIEDLTLDDILLGDGPVVTATVYCQACEQSTEAEFHLSGWA